jgi:hypothetical protein
MNSADEQQRRPEAEQQLRDQRRACVGDSALTCTPCDCSRFVRLVLSQNEGTSVENSVWTRPTRSSADTSPALERAFDRVALRRDRLHLAGVDLREEERAEGTFTRVSPSG